MLANIEFEDDIIACLKVLNEGGIILYPTDTVWGIGCDATNEQAVEKIIQLKNRSNNKNFVVLVASEKDVLQYTASTDLAIFNYLENTTKPTTVIYDNAIGLAQNVVAQNGSVAIRICNHDFSKTLIKRFRKPIVSTSANISQQSTPAIFNDIEDEIKNGVDYCVKHQQNNNNPATPSQIIQFVNGKVEVIRG